MTATSDVRPDGSLIEMIYRPNENATAFLVYKNGEMSIGHPIKLENGITLEPLSPDNDLVRSNVILFPSDAEEYIDEKNLINNIQGFIHKYLQVCPEFEKIATYYVLFTWVYDRFSELPYLRLLGDYGSGKSRGLKVIGAICYKPIFANGAITISPIFRVIELSHGTLIINEADFKESDL